jgi:hypothetical protein
MVPFTIVLLDRQAEDSVVQPLCLQVDPGSKTTGFALVRQTEDPEAEKPVVTVFSLIERLIVRTRFVRAYNSAPAIAAGGEARI